MFVSILLLAMVITNHCYSMIQKEEISIKQIIEPEELKQGLELTITCMAKKTDLSAEQKEYLEYRFVQLQTRVSPHDIFIYDEKKNIIGFLASHLASDNKYIILDNFYASEDVQNIYTRALVYIQKIYPQTNKVWLALLKHDANSKWAQRLNLEKSDYMDTLHNSEVFQGWEQNFSPK